MHASEFDRLVSGFYAAATGEVAWSDALRPFAEAFSARAAAVQTFDGRTGQILQLSLGGSLPSQAQFEYMRDWHVQDPRKQHLMTHSAALLGSWWQCADHFDDAFVQSNPFYTDFLPAYQTRFLATRLLSPGPNLLTAFALELPAERGPLTADERHVVERLGHHASEALRQYERVRRMAASALAGHKLLDAFPYPVWLVDDERYVFYRNAAADDISVLGDRAWVHEGRLQLARAVTDRELGIRLVQLAARAHGARALVDARSHGSDAIAWMHLVKLEPMAVLGAFGERPLVMATLFASDRISKLDAFALAEVFRLTPAQARVAVLVADGITADEIATQLGCGVPTVRTHIAHVMSKLGARRMSDAVRLLRQGEALWASAKA